MERRNQYLKLFCKKKITPLQIMYEDKYTHKIGRKENSLATLSHKKHTTKQYKTKEELSISYNRKKYFFVHCSSELNALLRLSHSVLYY